jgi:hypothetical protein
MGFVVICTPSLLKAHKYEKDNCTRSLAQGKQTLFEGCKGANEEGTPKEDRGNGCGRYVVHRREGELLFCNHQCTVLLKRLCFLFPKNDFGTVFALHQGINGTIKNKVPQKISKKVHQK